MAGPLRESLRRQGLFCPSLSPRGGGGGGYIMGFLVDLIYFVLLLDLSSDTFRGFWSVVVGLERNFRGRRGLRSGFRGHVSFGVVLLRGLVFVASGSCSFGVSLLRVSMV